MTESEILAASRVLQNDISKNSERIAAIEANLQHCATQKDVTNLKVWILSGVVTGILISIGFAITIIKLFWLP